MDKATLGILATARGGLGKILSPTWLDDYILVYKTTSDSFVMEAKPSGGGADHNILSATHLDTLAAAVVRGDILIGNVTPKWARLPIGASGFVLKSDGLDVLWGLIVNANVDAAAAIVESKLSLNYPTHPQLHKDAHKSGGSDAFVLADLLDCLARLEVKKAGISIGKRRGLNLIEGTNVTLTMADDPTNEEVDVTIAATGGGGVSLPGDISFLALGANLAWTNQPAALTEFVGSTRNRTRYDLTNATQARLIVNVMTAGAATPAKIRAQYSTDLTNWYYLDGASGPSVDINTTGLKVSAWVSLAAGAKADVYLRIVGIDGNGTADPAFGNIALQVK